MDGEFISLSNNSKISPLKQSKKKIGIKNIHQHHKLDKWLRKKGVISDILRQEETFNNNSTMSDMSKSSKQIKSIKKSNKPSSALKPNKTVKQKSSSHKHTTQSTLGAFVIKEQIKPSVNKNTSEILSESCDSPSIKIITPSKNESRLFEKYGIMLPTVEEVLQEKRELEDYKNQLNAFQVINEADIQISFALKKSETCSNKPEKILDCKDLTLKTISKAVRKNLEYLKNIMYERVYNERHKKFSDKNKKYCTVSTEDLTYNNSMILFSYEQIECMLTKLQKYLDPEDKLTKYFFQVLLPELCIQIFMEAHNMSYEEALIYLDTRPLE